MTATELRAPRVVRPLSPHEVRLVIDILEDPRFDADPDPDEMARAIVRAVNARRAGEKLFVVGVQPPGRAPTLHGPFVTLTAATKYLESGLPLLGYGADTPLQAAVIRVLSLVEGLPDE
jgi:hypothetical protein